MPVTVDFAGEVALITGAATGLGFAIAGALGRAGATVALTDLSRERVDAAVAALREQEIAAQGFAADVRDAGAMAGVVDEIGARLGRLDVAVASAGIYPNTPLLQLTPEEWDRVLDTNLKGAFITCQAAARLMIAGGRGGRIVTISSGAANHAIWGWAHYSASKAGVVALTRALALELAPHGIRANAILPGYIDVPEGGRPLSETYKEAARRGIPLRRGEPADIANAVVMLASPLAGFVTGAALSVDGGSSAGRAHLRPVEE
ncbi:MAG TPA: SDR family NAD(P)-dependent oxidoreductase [Thermomicrobiaceae bacterium]|nr:SDR family NAD(P)-dependent oxidoreductase [Thermomicrobiaceae bacterium]